MTAVITADEVNLVVYRYLLESGFTHSAFTFAHEALVDRSRLGRVDVPPGALIQFLHKGLQYTSVETHLQEDGHEMRCDAPFSLVTPHECTAQRASAKAATETPAGTANGEPTPAAGAGASAGADAAGGVTAEAVVLEGHTTDTMTCAWNPNADLLASGSNDATARIWTATGGSGAVPSVVLTPAGANPQENVITVLDWNPSGTSLATGSQGGMVQVWDQAGSLQASYTPHTGPVMALRWNGSGALLLSGSLDKTTAVWAKDSGEVRQRFSVHGGEILDVDWQNDSQFASCSTDQAIHVCSLGRPDPVASFTDHTADINMVRWDPSKTLLGSASDDGLGMVWSLSGGAITTLRGHDKEVYAIQWSPQANPLTVATASYDSTVKMWDASTGSCIHTLGGHTAVVYSVAFSPAGDLLASGAHDNCIHIWSTKDGSLVKSYKGSGTVFEVSWNGTGDKVAACFAGGALAVVECR